MVIVLSPDALSVVPDVGVVVSALSCAIMNADTVQVVRHALQRRILVVEQTLLLSDLILQARDLCPHLVLIGAQHLLEQV